MFFMIFSVFLTSVYSNCVWKYYSLHLWFIFEYCFPTIKKYRGMESFKKLINFDYWLAKIMASMYQAARAGRRSAGERSHVAFSSSFKAIKCLQFLGRSDLRLIIGFSFYEQFIAQMPCSYSALVKLGLWHKIC